MGKHSIEELYQMQSLPLSVKVNMSKERIRSWVNEFGQDNVFVSFSGGKDSTVLLDIVRKDYPNVKAVFSNTGLELTGIREFVKTVDNVIWVKPEMSFRDVVLKYGYPIVAKEVAQAVEEARKYLEDGSYKQSYDRFIGAGEFAKDGKKKYYNLERYAWLLNSDFKISAECCKILKKNPMNKFAKENNSYPITGQMADESRLRRETWLKSGCNIYQGKHPKSNPLSFWRQQDILEYIYINNLPIASVYGEVIKKEDGTFETTGLERSGCAFCGFGCQRSKDTRFIQLAENEPQIWEWLCKPIEDGGLNYREVIDWLNNNAPNRFFHIQVPNDTVTPRDKKRYVDKAGKITKRIRERLLEGKPLTRIQTQFLIDNDLTENDILNNEKINFDTKNKVRKGETE